jgi:hypothetical protein
MPKTGVMVHLKVVFSGVLGVLGVLAGFWEYCLWHGQYMIFWGCSGVDFQTAKPGCTYRKKPFR